MARKIPDDGLTNRQRYYRRHREEELARQRARRATQDRAPIRAYEQQYRATHREEIRARDRREWPKRAEKEAARKKAAYAANPEVYSARSSAYYQEHKEEIKAKVRAYLAEHHEEKLLKDAAYRAEHKEERALYDVVNREKHNQNRREHRRKHPEINQQQNAARKARKKNAPVNDLSAEQWKEIKAAFDNRCAYCGRKMKRLTRDHVTPYAHNGSNTLWNVVPACASCNSKKGTRPPLKPVQPLLLTIAPSKRPKAS